MFSREETIRQGFLLCSIIILLQFLPPFSSPLFAQVPWSQVYGKVTDKDTGEGIPLMWVCALKVEDGKVTQSFKERTNSRGVFLIDQVPSGDYLIFPYPAQGYVSNLPENTTYIAPGRTGLSGINIEFALEKGGGVAGRVTGEDGSPIANVEVFAYSDKGTSGRAITDHNGVYIIGGIKPSSNVTTVAIKSGFGILFKRGLNVQKNQIIENIDFIFKELSIIQGNVSNIMGNPIKNALILAHSPSNYGFTQSDYNGNFYLKGLQPDNYIVTTWFPKYKPSEKINVVLHQNTSIKVDFILQEVPKQSEKNYLDAKFILTGTPPDCCPCPPCPDCPAGIWIALTAPQILGAAKFPSYNGFEDIGVGGEGGIIIYQCAPLGIQCVTHYICPLLIGPMEIISFGVAGGLVIGAPCIKDLEGFSCGIICAAGPLSGTILIGSSVYFEVGVGIGLGGGCAFVCCHTYRPDCDTPCPY